MEVRMTDAQWVGVFFGGLLLLVPLSFLWTLLRRRRGHYGTPTPHVTDGIRVETLVDLERNRANRT